MDEQLKLLLKSVKENGEKMDGIDQKLTQLTNKFNVLERKVTLNEGSIHTIRTNQTTESKRITFLEQHLAVRDYDTDLELAKEFWGAQKTD